MIEAPLDRGKWRKEEVEKKREGREWQGFSRGELTRKIWHLARPPPRFLPLASVRFLYTSVPTTSFAPLGSE